ncbi:hypothetical protein H2201_007823 [Coniosporium apollinis]|uniref:Agmatinase n=1 Tax=Coniosporium apollinis TaxID=61459 RepID=A0ABQ9NIK7_9PEZI|nr:hypothetical protein H2201_007823 [Coniosporium apollinis]
MYSKLLSFILPLAVTARDVVFPPVSGVQGPLVTNEDDAIAEFPKPNAYAGLTTFANSAFVRCLADGEVERFDIAFLGAPFDTGVTARPGARFGPGGIRQGSRRISAGEAWSVYTGMTNIHGDAASAALDASFRMNNQGQSRKPDLASLQIREP